ncbi:Mobile element protein [Candidatus Enterovibrio altilux]|uniref:Mobile element protein n=1 Tax=Candidatus Enterovibrio altilux TaxID=1927128 RepID=A0A291B9Y8_9GAMM|nr:Mobile element protein [Candidatus Enterovibrio luxaltus]
MDKLHYKIINWKQYNKDLINSGSLILLINEQAIRYGIKLGRVIVKDFRVLNDLDITMAFMVKRVFSMLLKILQGFIDSVHQPA